MSTYYYLYCPEHKRAVYSFARQAWGWGNEDAFESFAFMAEHNSCEPHVKLLDEHCVDFDEIIRDEALEALCKQYDDAFLASRMTRKLSWQTLRRLDDEEQQKKRSTGGTS